MSILDAREARLLADLRHLRRCWLCRFCAWLRSAI